LQQVQDLSTIENDGRRGLISDLIIAEDSMQENQLPISDCDKVNLAIPDLDSDRDDEEIIEAFFDFSLQQQSQKANHLVTQDHNQHTISSSLLEAEGIFHLDSQHESYEMKQ